MTTTITGASVSTATVAATTSVTTDLIQYDTAKNEAGGFTKQQVVQVVNVTTGAYATTSTTIPNDDTIPQITEGSEFMTLAITPKSATNVLRIDVVGNWGENTNTGDVLTVALFQDSTANALACMNNKMPTLNQGGNSIAFSHYMVAGTASATTFRVRAGNNAGALNFNGWTSGRKMGGVIASSITITEYTP
tara:strand:+ start:487 stop:1062 length:576 start_codon:yes stop_codon:yes gene_type:complete